VQPGCELRVNADDLELIRPFPRAAEAVKGVGVELAAGGIAAPAQAATGPALRKYPDEFLDLLPIFFLMPDDNRPHVFLLLP
jgi:hypothetical protein